MTKHAKNKQLKQIENQSQSGRSMIEMLGVLAIVAILSIGGIIMFRYAMNYYQADQIAHEMNIMRTDAQIKIAQGTEKLTLGEPYDPLSESTLGHIQFNDDYPIDFACALADDETVELSGISCHVANAYYIELQNVPEGVCRPLAELLNGLSDIIAFNVNKKEYPDKGNCEAGNENILNAVFSAEAVSNLVFCETSTDCNESPNTPYCDDVRHVCVECVIHDDCGDHTQYCEENTCITCPNEKVWDGTDCVECTADSDCPTETPKCEGKTCKRCAEIDKRTPVWNGEKCVECMADDDCTDPDTPVCYTEEYKCVECLTYSDCKNEGRPQCDEASHTCKSCADIDSSKPVWAGTQCVECVESTDCAETLVCKENICGPCETEEECQEKGENYHCSKEDKCIQCSSNLVWGGQEKGCVECTEDNDCTDTPDTPKCNTTANKCVECMNSTDCAETLVCKGNECTTCQTEAECQAKGESYHCSKDKTCIQCPANHVWGGKDKGCVECTADGDCADTPDTPKCNTTANKCVPCLSAGDCKNPTPICNEKHTCVACKTSDECRLKNPSEENCVTGGACCVAEGMTWKNGKCACPADYGISDTTSGKKMCLPYCKQEAEVGVVLLIDRSASTHDRPDGADSNNKYEAKINRALDALIIPKKLKIAVYLDDGVSEKIIRNPLSYGTYSADTIKNAIHNYQLRYKPSGTIFTPALQHIQSNICTGQEKLLIVMWTDAYLDSVSNDTKILNQIKNNNCPDSKFYLIAPSNSFSSITDAFFSINSLPESYTDILNQAIRQESCIERE